jgi:hypothetical protein
MAVSVAEFERLDTAAAGGHGVIEKVRCAGRECRLTISFPDAAQRLSSPW